MRFTLLLIAAALVWAAPAEAHGLAYKVNHKSLATIEQGQKRNLAHVQYVCAQGRGHPKVWSCKAKKWLARELAETRATREQRARPQIDGCTMEIINREGSGFDPARPGTWARAATRPNSHGSGAYGVPQAMPGSKMRSAGPDWATNVWTQIKWMISYMEKYGGSCGALAFWNANHYY